VARQAGAADAWEAERVWFAGMGELAGVNEGDEVLEALMLSAGAVG
jgi:hypothetical protein